MYGRKYVNVLCGRTFDERLLRPATPCDAICDIVNDEVFDTRHHVEIIQSEIRVNNTNALARAGKSNAEVRRHGRLPHAALSGSYNNFSRHKPLPNFAGRGRTSKPARDYKIVTLLYHSR